MTPRLDLWFARAALILVGAFGAVGCASETDEADETGGTSESAILGGQVETQHPAVGMLKFASGSFGTGTLVAPNVVLTAAHVAAGKPKHFFYGVPAAGRAPQPESLRSVAVLETLAHPCSVSERPWYCPKDAIDVALVRLATPIRDVTPVPMVIGPLEAFFGLYSPYEGDVCVAVGFGAHLAADGKPSMGTRRSAKSTIESVGDTELVTIWKTGIATSGDSGGPLICAGRIVGTVRGSASKVRPQGYNRTQEGYERTDLVAGWVQAGIRDWR